MAEERVLVYTAQQGRDADILIMQLSRAGIEAAKHPGQESDHAPQWLVTVSPPDEYHAREVVGQFEQDRRDVSPPGAILGQDSRVDAREDDDSLHNPTTVYSARSVQEAHFLKNLLIESGINSMVSNELLHRGSGVDLVGLPTAAKVVVAAKDAETARLLALEFDRRIVEPDAMAGLEQDESVIEVAAPWPRCPQCDTRRTTKCPICPASGTDFEVIDPEFAGSLGRPGDTPDATGGCASNCSCGPERQDAAPQSAEAESDQPPSPKTGPPRMALMCSICDEPFVPEFPRRCEWCGHEFADGYDLEDLVEHEAIPLQAMIVILGLVTLLLVTCAYFAWLV